jgi:hypothetical protein
MVKTWTVRAVLSIAALSVIAEPAVHAVPQFGDLENICMPRKLRSFIPIPGVGDGPICQTKSGEELLLLTSIAIDNAARSAVIGVGAAQDALHQKQTLEADIAMLDRQANGIKPGDPKDTEAIIARVSEESDRLNREIQERAADNALDETARTKLAEAQQSLNEVEYYGTSATVGGVLFAKFLESGKATKTFYENLTLRLGLRHDVVMHLPDRASKVPGTLKNAITLRNTIAKVVRHPADEDDGAKRAKKLMKDKDKQVQEGLKGYPLTQTAGKSGWNPLGRFGVD